jgi:hypothetical protein
MVSKPYVGAGINFTRFNSVDPLLTGGGRPQLGGAGRRGHSIDPGVCLVTKDLKKKSRSARCDAGAKDWQIQDRSVAVWRGAWLLRFHSWNSMKKPYRDVGADGALE